MNAATARWSRIIMIPRSNDGLDDSIRRFLETDMKAAAESIELARGFRRIPPQPQNIGKPRG